MRFFAAAKASSGVDSVDVAWDELNEDPDGSITLAALQSYLLGRFPTNASAHAPELAKVFKQSSFLVNGRATRDLATPITTGAAVDVLPPFAGG